MTKWTIRQEEARALEEKKQWVSKVLYLAKLSSDQTLVGVETVGTQVDGDSA